MHYRPNHTIIKVKFLSKNSILTKPQQVHEFFTQNFFDNFSREIKVVNSLKVQTRSIFTSNHQNNSTIFLKVEFLDKKLRFRTVWKYKYFSVMECGAFLWNRQPGSLLSTHMPRFWQTGSPFLLPFLDPGEWYYSVILLVGNKATSWHACRHLSSVVLPWFYLKTTTTRLCLLLLLLVSSLF